MSGILEPIKNVTYKTMLDLSKADGDRNEAIMFCSAFTSEADYTSAALENGTVVTLTELLSDGAWVATAPADVTADDLYLHCSPEVGYDEREVSKEDFEMPAATALDTLKGRVKKLRVGNRITISTNGIDTYTAGTTTFVYAQDASVKLKGGTAKPETNGLVFKVLKDTTIGFNDRPAVELYCLGAVTKPAV